MATYLDLDTWPRRPQLEFFRTFTAPFWDVVVPVDVGPLREICQGQQGPSFSLACIYLSLRAANAVENFRYRLRGDRVLVHPILHGSSTILRQDETFGFSYFPHHPDFPSFAAAAAKATAAVKATSGLDDAGTGIDAAADPESVRENGLRDDLIYYSILPWLHFTSFQHARHQNDPDDSVPRLTFGKYERQGDRWRMPVSLSLHHALADGLHAGRFFERFEKELADPRLD